MIFSSSVLVLQDLAFLVSNWSLCAGVCLYGRELSTASVSQSFWSTFPTQTTSELLWTI